MLVELQRKISSAPLKQGGGLINGGGFLILIALIVVWVIAKRASDHILGFVHQLDLTDDECSQIQTDK